MSKIPFVVPDAPDRYAGVPVLTRLYVDRLLNSPIGTEVVERLGRGYSVVAVAEFVHERDVLPDCSIGTVTSILTTMRNAMMPIEKAEAISPAVRRVIKDVDNGLDVLTEIRDLYTMQRQRIEIDLCVEQASRKLLPTTHREVKIALDLLSQYAKVQMDFGFVKRQLGTVEVTETESPAIPGCSDRVNSAMADPRRRQRLLGVLHRLTALEDKSVEEHTIVIESEDEQADDC